MEYKKDIPIKIDKSRKTYNNKELDVTFIEIKKEDKIKCTYLELDSDLELDEEILKIKYDKKSIYIIQYPGKEICVSYGIIKFLNNFDINHFCNTESGTSGSPILSLDSFKIIGIHRRANINQKYNTGTLLKKAIEDFKNKFLAEINIKNNNENLNYFNTNIIFKNPNKIIKMNEINIKLKKMKKE
jgi:V8-like Glu-specific endopeptidase